MFAYMYITTTNKKGHDFESEQGGTEGRKGKEKMIIIIVESSTPPQYTINKET